LKKNSSTFFISLIVLLLLVYGCGGGGGGGGGGGVLTGGVEGTVYKYNTTEVVRYARINCEGLEHAYLMSDIEGKYSILNVGVGERTISVTEDGFSNYSTTINIKAGEVITHDIYLLEGVESETTSTDSKGETTLVPSTEDVVLKFKTVDIETGQPIAGISTSYYSDGENVIISIYDPSNQYAPLVYIGQVDDIFTGTVTNKKVIPLESDEGLCNLSVSSLGLLDEFGKPGFQFMASLGKAAKVVGGALGFYQLYKDPPEFDLVKFKDNNSFLWSYVGTASFSNVRSILDITTAALVFFRSSWRFECSR